MTKKDADNCIIQNIKTLKDVNFNTLLHRKNVIGKDDIFEQTVVLHVQPNGKIMKVATKMDVENNFANVYVLRQHKINDTQNKIFKLMNGQNDKLLPEGYACIEETIAQFNHYLKA